MLCSSVHVPLRKLNLWLEYQIWDFSELLYCLTAAKCVCAKYVLFYVAPNTRKSPTEMHFEKEISGVSFYERLHLKPFCLWTLTSYWNGYAKATKTHLIKLIVLVILSISEGLTYFISVGTKSHFWKPCDRR